MITLLLLVHATYMYGVVLHAHPVRGESYNQRNTTGEVATVSCWQLSGDHLPRLLHYYMFTTVFYKGSLNMSSAYAYEPK